MFLLGLISNTTSTSFMALDAISSSIYLGWDNRDWYGNVIRYNFKKFGRYSNMACEHLILHNYVR